MLQSFRMHYFGTFAVILPLCRLIDDARELRPAFFASPSRRLALGALVVAPLLVCLLHLLVRVSARHQQLLQPDAPGLRRRSAPPAARRRAWSSPRTTTAIPSAITRSAR